MICIDHMTKLHCKLQAVAILRPTKRLLIYVDSIIICGYRDVGPVFSTDTFPIKLVFLDSLYTEKCLHLSLSLTSALARVKWWVSSILETRSSHI